MHHFIKILALHFLCSAAYGQAVNPSVFSSSRPAEYERYIRDLDSIMILDQLYRMPTEADSKLTTEERQKKAVVDDSLMKHYDSLNRMYLVKNRKNLSISKLKYLNYQSCLSIFLIIQHAPLDFQKKQQSYVLKMVRKGYLDNEKYALFIDRLKLNQKKKQIYGTQFINKNGETHPYPIKNAKQVNKRRFKLGLNSLEDSYKDYEDFFKVKIYR